MEPAATGAKPVECQGLGSGRPLQGRGGAVQLLAKLLMGEAGGHAVFRHVMADLVAIGQGPGDETRPSAIQMATDQKQGGRHPQIPQQVEQCVAAVAARSVVDRDRDPAPISGAVEQHRGEQWRQQPADQPGRHQRHHQQGEGKGQGDEKPEQERGRGDSPGAPDGHRVSVAAGHAFHTSFVIGGSRRGG
jgi:hypothetical protein